MMMASLRSHLPNVLGAYGLAVLGAIIGAVLRFVFDLNQLIAPYHCYDWEPKAATTLATYLLIAPVATGLVTGRARIVAISLMKSITPLCFV